MDISENSKDFEKLYNEVCRILKQLGKLDVSVPSKKKFYIKLKRFNELIEGHKSLLFAIGKL